MKIFSVDGGLYLKTKVSLPPHDNSSRLSPIDFRKKSLRILKALFTKRRIYNPESFFPDKEIMINGNNISAHEFMLFVSRFHDLFDCMHLLHCRIVAIHCNPGEGMASVQIKFSYKIIISDLNVAVANERMTIYYSFKFNEWYLTGLECDAFGVD